jgi:hypothetical protein
MATRTPTVEQDRPPRRRGRVAIISILGVAAGSSVGGACAWLAGWLASSRIWGEDWASISANWCLFSYLASSLLSSMTWLLLDRDGVELEEWVVRAILQNLGFGVLSFPLAFASGYIGKVVGGVVGVFTAPFGSTWLDLAASTSAQGCLIGIVVGVTLPWLILLKARLSDI